MADLQSLPVKTGLFLSEKIVLHVGMQLIPSKHILSVQEVKTICDPLHVIPT